MLRLKIHRPHKQLPCNPYDKASTPSKQIWQPFMLVLAGALLGIVLKSGALYAQQKSTNPQAIMVLDGSGSMWGKIKDGHKILITRSAIANSLRPFEDKIDLGLQAFGHRRRGACEDIQLLSKPAPLNPLKFSRLVKQIKPLGKTPITSSIQQASKTLQASKGGTIILLADGPENCRKNPCRLISPEFAKSQNIIVHVIAFSMTKKDSQSLRCLASNSGGKFLTPNNKVELETALTATLNASIKSIFPKTKAPSPSKKRTKPAMHLTAHLGPQSQALKNNLSWTIEKLNKANKPEKDLPPWESKQPNPKFELIPGKYRITTEYKDYQISKQITLQTGDLAKEKIILNLSELLLPASWEQPNSRSGFGKLLLKAEDETDPTAETTIIELKETSKTQLIPSGAYKLTGIENGDLQTWFIHAEAGKTVTLPIWKNTGRISFLLQDATNKRALTTPLIQLFKAPSASNPEKPGHEVARSTAKNPQFDLAGGLYTAKLQDGFAQKSFPITIAPNKQTTRTLKLERATLRINTSGKAAKKTEVKRQESTLTIYQITKNKQQIPIGTATDLSKDIHLNPGSYRFILNKGSSSITKTAKLKAGKTTTLKFISNTTKITFKISDRTDPLSRHQIFWQLFEKSGALIWQSTKPEPSLNLPSGQYRIYAEIGNDTYSQPFKIKGVTSKTIDLAQKQQ